MNSGALSTDRLIDHLLESLPEQKKVAHSAAYFFIGWLAASIFAVLVYLNVFLAVRFDLIYRLTDMSFVLSVGSMFLGSCFFAYGALANAIPGSKSISDSLGVVCSIVWMGLILATMAFNFDGFAAGKVYLRFDLNIFLHMVVASVIPLALLWVLILQLAPVKPKRIAMSACIASLMLSATMLRLFFVHLYEGADCAYTLFIWMVVPLIVASIVSGKLLHSQFRMKSIDKAEFLDRKNRVEGVTAFATSEVS